MEKASIEDGYTLPERRKACRATDVPVSNAEYRRLRNLEKVDTACEVYADLDKVTKETAKKIKECDRLIVERGEGKKAAKASSFARTRCGRGGERKGCKNCPSDC